MTFDDVRPGRWIVALEPRRRRAAGPEDYAATALSVDVGPDGADVALEVVRGLYISGQVLDPDGNGQQASTLFQGGGVFLSESTESDGTFRIGPLPRGGGTLMARAWGASDAPLGPSETVEVDSGQEGIVLRLQPGTSVTVRAMEGGEPCKAEYSIAPPRGGGVRLDRSGRPA